ncbi:MAG: hypothetical protein NWE99_00845 [Candidatus Bathyarchaeota archaeon]|nr:hypothetical protein [Candidatus Bathyarchaeota archaeon]
MVKWRSAKRKWLLAIVAVALSVVALTLIAYQVLILSHMYPQDALHADSNLSLKGVVTSIEVNRRVDGMNGYHIFRFYYRVNITQIVWVKDSLSGWVTVSYENCTLNGWNSIGVGYDCPDKPELAIGQTIECKGYYGPVTDSPYSFQLTIAPTINGSYLKTVGF